MSVHLELADGDVGGPVMNSDQSKSVVAQVREEWKARLPVRMQPFLTWLIGFPYLKQETPIKKKRWWFAVAVPVVVLVLGLVTSFAIVSIGGFAWLLLPIAWILEVNGARTLQVQICHHGVHRHLTGIEWSDKLLVEVISTFLMIQPEAEYRREHCKIHHADLSSADDPDRKFTVDVVGICPGNSVFLNFVNFCKALVSPKVHAIFEFGRLLSNLKTPSIVRRSAFIAWFSVVVFLVMTTIPLLSFFAAVVVPLLFLCSCSAICQFVTEHFWALQRKPGQSAYDHHMALLLNRHLGDPLPNGDCAGLEWLQKWSLWWARLIFYHVPFRLTVLVGDLPVHGSHHLWPMEKRWTEAIFVFRDRSKEDSKSPTEFVGGYFALLCFVLNSFAAAQRTPSDQSERLGFGDAIKVANGM